MSLLGPGGRDRLVEQVQRARVRAADKAFPGGLVAHVNPPEAVEPPEPPEPERPVVPDGAAVVEDLATRTLPVEAWLQRHGPLARELAASLTDEDRAALASHLKDDERAMLDAADNVDAGIVAVSLALFHGIPGVAERTGRSATVPPTDVHAMSHIPRTSGGDGWYADLLAEALAAVGAPLGEGQRVLDYGCSSGRVVRMLAARRPDVAWEGCDVNAPAIAWAAETFPAITFREQPLRPPLSYADGHFDAAYAISIWSHYAAAPALAWLDEMHRVIRPGGHLLITTHGESAVAARAADPAHGPAAQAAIVADLYRDGFVFIDLFGDDGDWGVVDREWGVAFLTPEWLLNAITPRWNVALYRTGAIDGHQDLYVLRRES